MHKLAIFVEGLTEQVFAEEFLVEIAGRKHLAIEKRLAHGGAKHNRRLTQISFAAPERACTHYVLIVNCSADNRVKSDIRDQYHGLIRAGYNAIVGILDVYPNPRESIPRLRSGLKYGLKTNPVEVCFIFGVMEMETWFISEHTHFEKLDKGLTLDLIRTKLGFDPSSDDIQRRDHPAQDLHEIYHLVGLAYKKTKNHLNRTVGLLAYEKVYFELPERIPDLRSLVDSIDAFLSLS
jgi:hypothetical protein